MDKLQRRHIKIAFKYSFKVRTSQYFQTLIFCAFKMTQDFIKYTGIYIFQVGILKYISYGDVVYFYIYHLLVVLRFTMVTAVMILKKSMIIKGWVPNFQVIIRVDENDWLLLAVSK